MAIDVKELRVGAHVEYGGKRERCIDNIETKIVWNKQEK